MSEIIGGLDGNMGRTVISKLLHWAVTVVKLAPFRVAASSLLTLAVQLAAILSVVLLGVLVDLVQDHPLAAKQSDAIIRGLLWITGGERTTVIWFIAAFTLLCVVLGYYSKVVATWSGARLVALVQVMLYAAILRNPKAVTDRMQAGEVQYMVLQAASIAPAALTSIAVFPVTQVIALVAAISIVVSKLELLEDATWFVYPLLALLVLVPFAQAKLATLVRAASRDQQNAMVALNQEFLNGATAPIEANLLGAGPVLLGRFRRASEQTYLAKVKAVQAAELMNQVNATIPQFVQIALVMFCVYLAGRGSGFQPGDVVALYFLVPQILLPIQLLGGLISNVSANYDQITRVGAFMSESGSGAPDDDSASPTASGSGEVVLGDVVYQHPDSGTWVAQHLTHHFKSNAVTAVVGLSGAGKSSLLSLMAGISRGYSGRITVAGADLATFEPGQLARYLCYVGQSPFFIAASVRENFALSKSSISDSAIEEACKALGVWNVLAKMNPSDPLSVVVPPTSAQGLSGGERRLLALARATLSDACVFLIDEPTTGISPPQQQGVVETIGKLARGATVILTDHNIDFINKVAVEVCVLEAGTFSTTGNPRDLMQGDNSYARFASSASRAKFDSVVPVAALPSHDLMARRKGAKP